MRVVTLSKVLELLKSEFARSVAKHGDWADLSAFSQKEAIDAEYEEWRDAYWNGDKYGDHGEVAELIQLANVALKRAMRLMAERPE